MTIYEEEINCSHVWYLGGYHFMSFIYQCSQILISMMSVKVNDFSARYIKPNAEHWFGTDSNW